MTTTQSLPKILIYILSFCLTLLVTQKAVADTTATKIDSARQNELRYFVRQDCGSCHGLTLKGSLGPALLPEALSGKSIDYLVTTILEGRDNTAMPPWKPMLNRNDATWIAEQLKLGNIAPSRPDNLAKGAQ